MNWAIAIMGPTAVGKSEVAEELARRLGCRIINADAFQVYKGFDIGTAKPKDTTNYDLIDICEPMESFSAGKFVQLATQLLKGNAVVCGGSGLYVRALFEDFADLNEHDPDMRAAVKQRLNEIGAEQLASEHGITEPETIANLVRLTRAIEKLSATEPPPHGRVEAEETAENRKPKTENHRRLKIGLDLPREALNERIRRRVETMVQNGFLREVEGLLRLGVPRDCPAFRAIGYREVADVVAGIATLDEAVERTVTRTRQYAKRQMTWLRQEPGLRWMDATVSPGEIVGQILKCVAEEK